MPGKHQTDDHDIDNLSIEIDADALAQRPALAKTGENSFFSGLLKLFLLAILLAPIAWFVKNWLDQLHDDLATLQQALNSNQKTSARTSQDLQSLQTGLNAYGEKSDADIESVTRMLHIEIDKLWRAAFRDHRRQLQQHQGSLVKLQRIDQAQAEQLVDIEKRLKNNGNQLLQLKQAIDQNKPQIASVRAQVSLLKTAYAEQQKQLVEVTRLSKHTNDQLLENSLQDDVLASQLRKTLNNDKAIGQRLDRLKKEIDGLRRTVNSVESRAITAPVSKSTQPVPARLQSAKKPSPAGTAKPFTPPPKPKPAADPQ